MSAAVEQTALSTKIVGVLLLLFIVTAIAALVWSICVLIGRHVAASGVEGYKHCIERGGSIVEKAPNGWRYECVGIKVPEL